MSALVALSRMKVETAYAAGDLDALRSLALTALTDLDNVIDAYDGVTRELGEPA